MDSDPNNLPDIQVSYISPPPRRRFSFLKLSTKRGRYLLSFLILVVIIGVIGGAFWGYGYFKKGRLTAQELQGAQLPKDPYAAFSDEVYEKIKQNYWEKISDSDLSNIFKLAAEKVSGHTETLSSSDKNGVLAMIGDNIKDTDNQKKTDFIAKLIDVVLANLKPFGRSRLYSEKQIQSLAETVNNVDTSVDLYKTLGVSRDATLKEVAKAYQGKSQELKKDKSPQAAEKLAQVNRAYQALSETEKKKAYDQTGAEPTIIFKLLKPNIAYLQIKRFSPATLSDFGKVFEKSDKNIKANTLIVDLRGNIGGAVDILPYFLGPFIGPDRYAYDFFRQGEPVPFKTKTGWLPGLIQYKKVVVLVDKQTQSSAEIMAAVIKKYNVGVLVGVPTKGWGTIEQLIPIDRQMDASEKFSLVLVQSITLRDDNQPIEGRGVDPAVNITDPNWKNQLFAYFNYQELINAIAGLVGKQAQ